LGRLLRLFLVTHEPSSWHEHLGDLGDEALLDALRGNGYCLGKPIDGN
jgi:hypothetical protein